MLEQVQQHHNSGLKQIWSSTETLSLLSTGLALKNLSLPGIFGLLFPMPCFQNIFSKFLYRYGSPSHVFFCLLRTGSHRTNYPAAHQITLVPAHGIIYYHRVAYH